MSRGLGDVYKRQILRKSILERKNLEEEEIKTVHVLLAILLDKNNIVSSALRHMKIDYDSVLEEYLNISDIKSKLDDSIENDDDIFGPSESDYQKTEKSKSSGSTPTLDNFGRDLTKYAEENRLDPIVGRISKLKELLKSLAEEKRTIQF